MVTSIYKKKISLIDPFSPYCVQGDFPKLSEDHIYMLGRDVSKDEIHFALKGMGGLKAPSPNGMQAVFYQSQWPIVGKDVCHLVSNIFHSPWCNAPFFH